MDGRHWVSLFVSALAVEAFNAAVSQHTWLARHGTGHAATIYED